MKMPKEGEYWVVTIRGALPDTAVLEREVVRVGPVCHYVCSVGEEEPWPVETSGITFIRKVRL